jgi:hypothetical protein
MNQGAQKPDSAKQNQTTGSTPQNQNATQTQNQGSQQSGASIQSQAGTQVTAQQQTRIQQSVLSARNAPRVNRVNFDIRTGAVVPRSVHFASVTSFPVLVEFFPQFRDHSFFVVEDEIVIVDRSHKIVDVVPAGPRARFSRAGGAHVGGGASSTTVVDLSEPEIRILQQTLIERGMLRGRVTGRFDDRTRQALIVFQRRQGFEATGRIDSRTVTSLGLSGRINAQDRSSTTQGQGGMQSGQSNTSGQAPSGQQGTTGQSNQPAQNQSSGQGQGGTPSAQQDKSGQAPSQSQTTGQGSPSSGSNSSGQSGTSGKSNGSSPSTSGQGSSQPPAQKSQPPADNQPPAQKQQ